ncbi:SDR family NAD(P)-dependent oxidoreductase [Candidatus Marinarcus aquaticus]|uniref:Short-chain dehydrogenase n=1 Tax=Candidatus Marinarcus aquaticus TaxID=2044504 RepID=A0A4Q0XVF5_9BACT|nr:SDR family oxidoreductase [Candidatus Marinarcus aquaticus]RXJ60584.1 short-chain dehydrogenase [Candidatus Marinarcus aquaticus]
MTKKVLITGGNKGIGLEVAKIFVKLEYEIYVVGRDFNEFELGGLPNVTEIEADLTNLDNISEIVKTVGDIDILINNAGFMQPHISYDKYTSQERENMMNVNLYAPVELMNEFSVGMKKQKCGRIVNVASIAGQIGHPDVWYGIAKAGLINATKIYAKLLGGDGIVVNCIAPSPVETDMQKSNSKERIEEFKKTVVTHRFARASEIARTIVWLAIGSPEYINGTCIDINNGAYPR